MKTFNPFYLLSIMLALLGCGESSNESQFKPLSFDSLTLSADIPGPTFTTLADLNRDGFSDIILSVFNKPEGTLLTPGEIRVLYGTGDTNRWNEVIVLPQSEEIYFPNDVVVEDMDGDGDLDLLVGSGFLPCPVLERLDSNGNIRPAQACGGLFWVEQQDDEWVRNDILESNQDLFYHRSLVHDFNNDGLNDILVVGEKRPPRGKEGDEALIQIFEGTMPLGTFAPPKSIGRGLGSLPELHDIDGDGDQDVVSAEYFANRDGSFVWFERLPDDDSGEMVWRRNVIDNTVGPSIQISMVDNLFGDGRSIAVGSNHSNTTIATPDPWTSAIYVYEAGADLRAPWIRRQISENIVSRPIANQAAPGIFGWGDLDGDGDLDLVVSGDGDERIFALVQIDGQRFETHVIAEDYPQAGGMKVADFDGDGTAEVVVTSYEENRFELFKFSENGTQKTQLATVPEVEIQETTRVRVNFDADITGPLIMAFFTEYPPMSQPFGFKRIAEPRSGDEYDLNFAGPGTYQLLAFIDADGSGIMGVSDADPYSVSTVLLPTTNTIELNLNIGDENVAENNGEMTEVDAADGNDGNLDSQPQMEIDVDDPIDDPNMRTTVRVNVNYAGPQNAKVTVGSFPSLPVMNAPDVFQVVDEGTGFPLSVTLDEVPGATCQILAFLAVGGNPTFPSTDDPKVESPVIELNGDVVEVNLTLIDP